MSSPQQQGLSMYQEGFYTGLIGYIEFSNPDWDLNQIVIAVKAYCKELGKSEETVNDWINHLTGYEVIDLAKSEN